jgi:hypothetical protein
MHIITGSAKAASSKAGFVRSAGISSKHGPHYFPARVNGGPENLASTRIPVSYRVPHGAGMVRFRCFDFGRSWWKLLVKSEFSNCMRGHQLSLSGFLAQPDVEGNSWFTGLNIRAWFLIRGDGWVQALSSNPEFSPYCRSIALRKKPNCYSLRLESLASSPSGA